MSLRRLLPGASQVYFQLQRTSRAANPIRSGGFLPDFQSFLRTRGYGAGSFARADAPSFGGRAVAGEKVTRTPVVLFHGNSDNALGWRDTVNDLLANGHSPAEVYAFSWGPMNVAGGLNQAYDVKYLKEMREAIEAVLEYTGAEKVNVISHSQGVAASYGAISGVAVDRLGRRHLLGKTLPVDTFIGIAGAMRGVGSAALNPFAPSSNLANGFHPLSRFTRELSELPKVARRVYSIGSTKDGVTGVGNSSVRTAAIPHSDGALIVALDHFSARDQTTAVQRAMLEGTWHG